MGTMNEQSKNHEEFRLALEKGFEQAMAAIAANKEIAREQADVLALHLAKRTLKLLEVMITSLTASLKLSVSVKQLKEL